MVLKEPFLCMLQGSMALVVLDLGSLLMHLVDGLERTLLPDFLYSHGGYQFPNGLERRLMAQICSSAISMGFCHLFSVNGLERSSWCCFLSFS